MSTVVGRWCGSDSIVELLQADDGSYVMTSFFRDWDMDRAVGPQEAGEWIDHIRRCGGQVYRGVSSWPVKDTQPQTAATEGTRS